MPKETILTAARRAVRDFNIDMKKGGLVVEATEISHQKLATQVEHVDSARKKGRAMLLANDHEGLARLAVDLLDLDGEDLQGN